MSVRAPQRFCLTLPTSSAELAKPAPGYLTSVSHPDTCGEAENRGDGDVGFVQNGFESKVRIFSP